MAQPDNPVQLQGCALRVTRCDATGATPAGANNMYVSSGLVKVTFKPAYFAGTEFNPQNACAALTATYKSRDILLRWDVDLELTTPDPELSEILVGGAIVTAAGQTIGQLAVPTGDNPPGNGCCLEVWAKAIIGGVQAATNPWFRYVAPLGYYQDSDGTIENADSNRAFTGFAIENPNIGNGPNNDFPTSMSPLLRSLARFRDSTIPTAAVGYQATPAQV